MTPEAYVVWSFEHDAWWGPGRHGYTRSLADAGHYTKAEADTIVTNANRYAKEIHEQGLPLSVATAYTARGWHPLTLGTYDDNQGGLHLVLSEMLEGHGYPDTPENRAMLIEAARALHGGLVEVVE